MKIFCLVILFIMGTQTFAQSNENRALNRCLELYQDIGYFITNARRKCENQTASQISCISFITKEIKLRLSFAEKECQDVKAGFTSCVRVYSEAGYFYNNAKRECEDTKPGLASCIRYHRERGFFMTNARRQCEDISIHTLQCMKVYSKAGYFYNNAKRECKNAMRGLAQCLKTYIDQGYQVYRARKKCDQEL
jgi:hypothetical protein